LKIEKKGLIYCPSDEKDWMHNSFMTPVPILMGDKIRIFGGILDKNNISRIGFIDVAANDPKKILYIHQEPVLDLGQNGCFDDNGVVPISAIEIEGKLHLYYIGFQLGIKVKYFMFCGLALSDNALDFKRYSKAPVLDRNNDDLYARCGCNIIKDNDKYKMYYVGSIGKGWTENSAGKSLPLYNMKVSESADGKDWGSKSGIECLSFENHNEHGFGRPSVIKHDNKYKMFYSIRLYEKGYRIGYAESQDGVTWQRIDSRIKDFTISESGWDSEMICYPALLKYNDKTYIFYNGNGMGKTGIGYAELLNL